MSRILVTGGAGYIGSVLVPELLRLGHGVTVIDNFRYQQTSLLDCCHFQHFRLIRGDVRDMKLVMDEMKTSEYIFPLACLTGAPLCSQQPKEAAEVNREAIKVLLRLKKDWQRIIFPTTNSGYGIGQDGIECNETFTLEPISYYGRLKVEAENEVAKYENTLRLRLATAFGISPRMRLDLLVNDFVYRAITDQFVVIYEAHFKRNYIHVRDIACAFLHGMENFETMKGRTYNVGLSNANLSKLELCWEIKKQVPDFYFHEAEIGKDPDQRNYIVSNAKIEATGFKPKVSLPEGIAELIRGFQIIRRNQFSNI